jgi:hypothetical protein
MPATKKPSASASMTISSMGRSYATWTANPTNAGDRDYSG